VKILIIKPSALGDIVQALPVLTGLKRRWPAAQIDWIVNDSLREILEGHPCLRQTIIYPRKRWTSPARIPEIWRWGQKPAGEKYDITIDLQGLLRSALMTWAANSPRRLGLLSAREGSRAVYNEHIADTAISAAERYLTCLEHLDIPVQPLDFQLTARAPLPEALKDFGPYIALHPYSRWRTKLWPWRYYQELIDAMPERRFVVVGEGPWFPLEAPGRLVDLRGKLDHRRAGHRPRPRPGRPQHRFGSRAHRRSAGPSHARAFRRHRLAQDQALGGARSSKSAPMRCFVPPV
jgi:heptosyltransferase I